jgi:N-acetylglucosamine-6-sulfatase
MTRGATRAAVFTLVTGIAVTAGPATVEHLVAAPPPNILFIMSDDHRWDGLGAAGNPNVHTPNLDRLAKEGVHFLQATMHVPQCSPGRAQLLTGLPTHTTGWYSNQYRTSAVDRTDGFARFRLLPALLKNAGYQTVFTGKWHLRPEPWDSGFAEVLTWLPGGGGAYQNLPLARGRSRELIPGEGYTQQRFADDAVGFLKSEEAVRRPFFMWVAFTAPHGPFGPNPPHIEQLYAGKSRDDLLPPGFKGDKAETSWNRYYESITFLDEQVGRLLHTLEERRLDRNTIVVFLGDNGFMMGNRGWNGKVLPYEGSVRVPLIVRAPGLAKVSGQTDAAASSLDLPPTFLRWAGLKPPAEWPGRDLTPALQRRAHGLSYAVSEFADNQSQQFGEYAYRLIRTPTHKLILWERSDKKDELYDLRGDPQETRNLAGDAALGRTERELRARLAAWMKRTGDGFPENRTLR